MPAVRPALLELPGLVSKIVPGARRVSGTPRLAAGDTGQSEIHLFLECVHLRHLHLDAVAKPDYAPRPAADQLISLHVKDVEVVLEAREVHEAAHNQIRHVHKESEVAHL